MVSSLAAVLSPSAELPVFFFSFLSMFKARVRSETKEHADEATEHRRQMKSRKALPGLVAVSARIFLIRKE